MTNKSEYVVATGESADEWSRHATESEAMAEARKKQAEGHEVSVWASDVYDNGGGNLPPIWESVRRA